MTLLTGCTFSLSLFLNFVSCPLRSDTRISYFSILIEKEENIHDEDDNDDDDKDEYVKAMKNLCVFFFFFLVSIYIGRTDG